MSWALALQSGLRIRSSRHTAGIRSERPLSAPGVGEAATNATGGHAMASQPSTILFLCSGNYYRSRFAELLFNHLVAKAGLSYRADSAGHCPNCRTHNIGSIWM